jgi:hypothetical protein
MQNYGRFYRALLLETGSAGWVEVLAGPASPIPLQSEFALKIASNLGAIELAKDHLQSSLAHNSGLFGRCIYQKPIEIPVL